MDRTKKMREYLKPYLVDHVHEKVEEAARIRQNYLFPSVTALLK